MVKTLRRFTAFCLAMIALSMILAVGSVGVLLAGPVTMLAIMLAPRSAGRDQTPGGAIARRLLARLQGRHESIE